MTDVEVVVVSTLGAVFTVCFVLPIVLGLTIGKRDFCMGLTLISGDDWGVAYRDGIFLDMGHELSYSARHVLETLKVEHRFLDVMDYLAGDDIEDFLNNPPETEEQALQTLGAWT